MRAVFLGLFYFLPTAAWAATFDVAAYCRQVSDAVGGSYQIELACRQEENRARSQLASMQVPERIRKYCTEVAQAVGGSYQIMVACVEQELEARRQLR